MLRGILPKKVEKRFKCFFYGESGVGKTFNAIQFPRPYLIDCERGAENEQYVDILNEKQGAIFQTSSFNDVFEEVKLLLSTKHDYKTLIIDPLTIIYNNLVDGFEQKFEESNRKLGFNPQYKEANKYMKRLLSMILRLDMNVIITAHEKDKFTEEGSKSLGGKTWDCYKKANYMHDLLLRIYKRNGKSYAVVEKTRVSNFILNEEFEFSYESICDKYGKDVLERDCIPQELASKDDALLLKDLLRSCKIPEESIRSSLEKRNAVTFEDLSREDVLQWIGMLSNRQKMQESSYSRDNISSNYN